MKYLLPIFLFLVFTGNAQESEQFTVSGKVAQQLTFNLNSFKNYQLYSQDSIVVYNHLLQRKSCIKNVKGVLLKDVLSAIEIVTTSPKKLSEYYIVCSATDGYRVVFSWNELFNTKNGNNVMVLINFDTNPIKPQKGNIAIIAPNDEATGRRFLKALNKITILQID